MNSQLGPSLALIIGGVLWGLFWIPLRALDDSGITGAWPGLLVYIVVVAVMLPMIFLRPGLIKSPILSLAWCGLFTGTAFALYATSLFFTDVVRVLLLFYITPVWSTLLGYFLLSERITASRLLALVLGLSGLLVVLGIGVRFPWPRNIGDWFALCSGLAWAYGSLCVYRLKDSGTYEQVLAFVIGGTIVSAIAILFGGPLVGPSLDIGLVTSTVPLIALCAMLLIPMLVLTIWPAKLLSPGRVGLLLMSEVVVGIASAAVLAGESFGLRETVGTFLVVSAGLVEVFGNVSAEAVA